MPLSEPQPPEEVIKAMWDGVHAKVYAQNLYTLRLEDVETKGIGGAKLTGCQYTGNLGGPEDQSIQVDLGYGGKAPQVTEFRYGEVVNACRDAIKSAKKWADAQPDEYELRLLRVPALSIQTVWLKATGTTADQMFPLSSGCSCPSS